ncbi:hypothetical protein HK098_003463 [Nowakowskiella sp. JEL0407]|nr:hypothetical protein HK098_003463 [Nowakowskiella sp. JEL0407]
MQNQQYSRRPSDGRRSFERPTFQQQYSHYGSPPQYSRSENVVFQSAYYNASENSNLNSNSPNRTFTAKHIPESHRHDYSQESLAENLNSMHLSPQNPYLQYPENADKSLPRTPQNRSRSNSLRNPDENAQHDHGMHATHEYSSSYSQSANFITNQTSHQHQNQYQKPDSTHFYSSNSIMQYNVPSEALSPPEEMFPPATHPVRLALDHVLGKAENAVSLDSNGLYTDALTAYRETIYGLERVLEKVESMLAGQDVTRAELSWAMRKSSVKNAGGISIPVSIPSDIADSLLVSTPTHFTEVVDRLETKDTILLKPSLVTSQKLTALMHKLIEIRDSYIERVELLLKHLPLHSATAYNNSASLNKSKLQQQPQFTPSAPALLMKLSHNDPAPLLYQNAELPEPPPPPARFQDHRVFWLMRLLSRTMINPKGAFLSTSLYVPREIWYQTDVGTTHTRTQSDATTTSTTSQSTSVQSGPKLAAIDIKITTCEELGRQLRKFSTLHDASIAALLHWSTPIISQISFAKSRQLQQTARLEPIRLVFQPPPPIAFDLTGAFKDLDDLDLLCDSLRATLSKKLKYLDDSNRTKMSRTPSDPGVYSPSITNASKSSLISTVSSVAGSNSKLSNWGNRLTKSVEKLSKVTAMTAALTGNERVVALDDLERYISLLIDVFGGAQGLERWLNHFENVIGICSVVATRGPIEVVIGVSSGGWDQLQIHASAGISKLRKIMSFFSGTICAFVGRDFELLWERYSKTSKQLLMQ